MAKRRVSADVRIEVDVSDNADGGFDIELVAVPTFKLSMATPQPTEDLSALTTHDPLNFILGLPFDTVQLVRGWNTFGQVVPPGVAFRSLQVGAIKTQTDVKCRWPDGSIKFAVVTAHADGEHLAKNPALVRPCNIYPGPAFEAPVNIPPIRTVFVPLDADAIGIPIKQPDNPDYWLSGPLVREWRSTTVIEDAMDNPLGMLSVTYGVREYNDGTIRIEVVVGNTVDHPSAKLRRYDCRIEVGDEIFFERFGIKHPYMTRWRHVFWVDSDANQDTTSLPTPTLKHAVDAGALPEYIDTIPSGVPAATGSRFDILREGVLNPYMGASGGRRELAPYPNWTARYLVHRTEAAQALVLKQGDLSGSWPVHLTDTIGKTVTLADRPNLWIDERADDKPAGRLDQTGPLKPDNAHQPSLAYIPWLVTGDRYYAEEMAHWANYCLLSTYPGRDRLARKVGRWLKNNQTRGIAWALRNLSDAAAWLPDIWTEKSHFQEKTHDVLGWLNGLVPGPLGARIVGYPRPENREKPKRVWVSVWEQDYLAWAIYHVRQQMDIDAVNKLEDSLATFQLMLFSSSSDGYPREYGAPNNNAIPIGTRDDAGKITYWTSVKDIYDMFMVNQANPSENNFDRHGKGAWIVLTSVLRDNPTAQEAVQYLKQFILDKKIEQVGGKMISHLERNSGWAFKPAGT